MNCLSFHFLRHRVLALKNLSFFQILLFLYFVTLHADILSITVSGFTVRFNNVVAFVLLCILFLRLRVNTLQIDKNVFTSLSLITISVIVSFVLSPYKPRCFVFLGWYCFTLWMYFLLPYFLIKFDEKQEAFSLYMLSFFVVGLFALLQFVCSFFYPMSHEGHNQFIFGNILRPAALCYEPSFYALYMTPFIVMVNYHFLMNRDEEFFLFKKITYKKILFFNFLYFFSTSTSTVFAFLLFFVFLLFSRQARKEGAKFLMIMALLFVFIGLISPFLIKTFFLKFFYSGFMAHHSFLERWNGIINVLNVFLSNPIFGVGLGGCPSYLCDKLLTGDNTFSLIQVADLGLSERYNILKILEPSNVFSEVLASLGLFGLFTFGFMIVSFLRKISRIRTKNKTFIYGLGLSVIVMLITLQINQGLLRSYIWVHLAMAFACLDKIKITQSAYQ